MSPSIEINKINFEELQLIYDKIPGVPCISGCMGCCVSPNITLIEFIFLMRFLYAQCSKEEVLNFLTKRTLPNTQFEGNLHCRFQGDNGFCTIHLGRGMACRLHGLPVIEELGVTNMENCTIMEQGLLPKVHVERVNGWLNKLLKLNQEIIPEYSEDFFHIVGLNIECWLDILFIDDITQDTLSQYQQVLRGSIPYKSYDFLYSPHSEIKEKIDTITLLKLCIDLGDKTGVEASLKKLKTGYPTTGSYFNEQCDWIEKKISDTN
ncbi:MAG: hypothetical protein HQK83_01595 [Fibrobacteria bacterium]|nr:hypothetical protein [Fibrobacteria bacterium]